MTPTLAATGFLSGILTAQTVVSVVMLLLVVHLILVSVAYSIYLERKISAYIQDRIGPNRVGFDFGLPFMPKFGFWGLGQPLADGLKFLLKEDYTPDNVDKGLFTLAPMAIIVPALIGFAIIPWGGVWHVPDFNLLGIPALHVTGGPVVVGGANVNIGIVYLLAVASLGVYGVTLGGWAGNNKYSFLGGLRSTAQMLSYEIPLGLALLAVLLIVGTVHPIGIVRYQAEHGWLLWSQPIACVLFFTSILAEANRAPFDNAEAEQELVGGYHTEYSSMRFALFFLAEYSHMITSSAFFALVFLGGWGVNPLSGIVGPDLFGIETTSVLVVLAKFIVYFTKVMLLVCFMMVIRWTLPRMRYDQVMMLGWQSMIPVGLLVVVVTSVMVYLGRTSTIELLVANTAMGLVIWAVQPLLPRQDPNRKVPLYGSRFNAVPGETISTTPLNPMAREDRPIEGTLGAR
jgi:NADH-quinone oxidoreductase subunit H